MPILVYCNRALVPAVMVTAWLFLLSACDDAVEDAVQQSAPPPAVTAVLIEKQEVKERVSFIGRVEAIDSVDIRARVEGFIESKSFRDGQMVEAGTKLFQIERAPYQAEVDFINAELRGAEALYKEAQINLERKKRLLGRGAVPQSEVDEAVAIEAKREAEIAKLKAELEKAELQLSYTEMMTPIAGRVGKTEISVGNLVGPSDSPLTQVISFDPIYVTIAISEKELINARREGFRQSGSDVVPRLELADGTLYEHDGKLDFVDNKVDPETDTITIRSTFPNPDFILFPNQFVTVFVERTAGVPTLLVPQSAVVEDQAGRFVLVVDTDNKAEKRLVKLGRQEGISFVVLEGLEEGEAVIVGGIQKVRPGQEVNAETVPQPALTEG